MKYTAADGTTQRDSNDAANWIIKTNFVEMEVLLDVTNFIERITELLEEPFYEFPAFYEQEYDPIEFPAIGYSFKGGDWAAVEKAIEEIEQQRDEDENQTEGIKGLEYSMAIQALREAAGEMPEIYCYYSVNEHFADQLRAHGHRVQEYGIHQIWGREAFGQSITCDSIIDKICIEMEIFEGQKYSWV